MQKVLLTANRLPQPDTYPRFRQEGGQDFDNAVDNCKSPLTFLLCSDLRNNWFGCCCSVQSWDALS